MPQQQHEASEVDKAEEVPIVVLVASRDSTVAQQPGEETLDLPASSVATERAAILMALVVVGARGRDQLDVLLGERLLEDGAVVCFVTDELAWLGFRETLLDGVSDESDFVTFT
jgi:hypothetical protein